MAAVTDDLDQMLLTMTPLERTEASMGDNGPGGKFNRRSIVIGKKNGLE
jgi:hypothetical protein